MGPLGEVTAPSQTPDEGSLEDPTVGHPTTFCENTGLVKVSKMGNPTILCLLGLCLFFLGCDSRPMYDNYGSQRWDRWDGDWDGPWGDYQDFQRFNYPSRYNDFYSRPQSNWRYGGSYWRGDYGDWDRSDWRDYQGFRDY